MIECRTQYKQIKESQTQLFRQRTIRINTKSENKLAPSEKISSQNLYNVEPVELQVINENTIEQGSSWDIGISLFTSSQSVSNSLSKASQSLSDSEF